jgi:hypothetical protein
LFCLFAICSIGCNVAQPVPSDTGGKEYYPVTLGYSWIYQNKDSSGSVTSTTTQSVTGTTSLFGKTLSIIRSVSSSLTSEGLFEVSDSAVKSYGTTTSPTSDAQTVLVFPLSVGSSWTVSNILGIRTTASVTTKENVTVSAGTFSCFKVAYVYNYSTITMYIDYWFAANVGLVKAAIHDFTDSSKISATIELYSKNF